jgi:CRP-like cAMP-binding protein
METMNMPETLPKLLRTVPYFGDLGPAALEAVAARCRSKVSEAGQMIFMRGDPCVDLCILESGRVMFSRVSAEGREQVLKVFDTPGDTFCMASAFSTGRHIANVQAAAQTRLYLLDLDTANRLVRAHPSMGLKLMAVAGGHMAHLVNLAEDLSLRSATERLAKYLHELAVTEGGSTVKAIVLARDRLREEALASILGTVRVQVSRSLSNLVRTGAIEIDRESVRILDVAALRYVFAV